MKQNRKVIIAGVVIILVVAAGIGLWNRSRSVANMSPPQQKIAVTNAMANLFKARTYHLATDLTFNLSDKINKKMRPFPRVELKTEGDVMQGATTEFTGTLAISAEGQGNKLSSHGELRLLSNATAFNLAEIPVILNPSGRLVKKWTYVPTPLFNVTNGPNITASFASVVQGLKYAGPEKVNGQNAERFSGTINADQHKALITALSSSGSPAFNQLSRILSTSSASSVSILTDERASQIKQIKAEFDKGGAKFATLTLTFSDFGKPVKVERPPVQLTVKPEVFANFFGRSQIAKNN